MKNNTRTRAGFKTSKREGTKSSHRFLRPTRVAVLVGHSLDRTSDHDSRRLRGGNIERTRDREVSERKFERDALITLVGEGCPHADLGQLIEVD